MRYPIEHKFGQGDKSKRAGFVEGDEHVVDVLRVVGLELFVADIVTSNALHCFEVDVDQLAERNQDVLRRVGFRFQGTKADQQQVRDFVAVTIFGDIDDGVGAGGVVQQVDRSVSNGVSVIQRVVVIDTGVFGQLFGNAEQRTNVLQVDRARGVFRGVVLEVLRRPLVDTVLQQADAVAGFDSIAEWLEGFDESLKLFVDWLRGRGQFAEQSFDFLAKEISVPVFHTVDRDEAREMQPIEGVLHQFAVVGEGGYRSVIGFGFQPFLRGRVKGVLFVSVHGRDS